MESYNRLCLAFSLSIMFPMFIHIVTCISILRIFYFLVYIIFHYMNIILKNNG